MKWSVTALVGLGLVAAIAVAIMVAVQRSGYKRVRGDVEAFYTTKAVPAMTIVAPEFVVAKKMPRNQLPADVITKAIDVVGKVLRVPMMAGQPFTASCLVTRESAANLAAAVPAGMRAMTLSLSDYGAMEGLLFPGSTVDVLASFKIQGPQTEVASITLLRGIQVLAINTATIVASEASAAAQEKVGGRKRLVTLKVTPKQAELLQLAQENGEISLALRNPMDITAPEDSSTLLSQVSAILARKYASPDLAGRAIMPGTQVPLSPSPGGGQMWQAVFMRGGVGETVYLPMPSGQPGAE